MVKTFAADCEAWFKDDVEGKATLTLQEAADTAAEAIVVGNEFGPGVPVDTGFARSSFRVALNEAVDGPSQPPPTPGRKPGDAPIFTEPLDTSAIEQATLDTLVYVTTAAEYAVHLEELGNKRRFGPNAGGSTQFIAPVEQRWPSIVEDAARRVGYGA